MKVVFDVGASNTRVAVSKDGKSLNGFLKKRTPKDFGEGMKFLKEMADEVSGGEKIDSVSVGIAGIVKDGILLNSPNLRGWEGNNIENSVKEIFSVDSVKVLNDAVLGCFGEVNLGAGKGHEIVAYLAIGTGIGGVRAENGKIDGYDYGFEPGRQIIDEKTGKTFEDLAGGKLFSDFSGKIDDLPDDDLNNYAHKIAVGIHNLIVLWSPDIFVLGGGMILNNPKLFELVKEKLPATFKDFPKIPELKKAELGDESVLWGGLLE